MRRMLRFSIGVLLVAAAAAQTPALRKGVSVQMPVTTNAAAMPDADLPDSLVVAVTARGTIYLEVTTVTPAELSGKVKAQLTGHPGQRLYLKADARVPYSTMGEVLDAVRTAGVNAPILLTSQNDSTNASHRVPMGFEVMLSPAPVGAPPVALTADNAPTSDAELKQRAQRDRPLVLQADGAVPFGAVIHAADVYRAAGERVFLATQRK